MKEFILCAANYYNDEQEHVHEPKNITKGFVVAGRRHHNCIGTFARIVGFPYSDEASKLQDTEVEGFITSLDRFVDRVEALTIALAANQIKDIEGIRNGKLYSEDLY